MSNEDACTEKFIPALTIVSYTTRLPVNLLFAHNFDAPCLALVALSPDLPLLPMSSCSALLTKPTMQRATNTRRSVSTCAITSYCLFVVPSPSTRLLPVSNMATTTVSTVAIVLASRRYVCFLPPVKSFPSSNGAHTCYVRNNIDGSEMPTPRLSSSFCPTHASWLTRLRLP